MTRRPSLISILSILFLLLAPCLLLWRVVALGEAFVPADLLRDISPWRTDDPNNLVPWNPLMWDGMAEFYPWRLFASNTLHHGILPFWNPHQFCGTPFVANSQSAIFYPLNLLFVLLPVSKAFGVSVILHLFLTGLFLHGFLRSSAFGLSRPAALLGAVTWQLSTWQVSWLALPTFLCVSTWLPLALWLTYRAIQRPSATRAALLGSCLGLMFLAGHLQIALYSALLIAAYALFCLFQTRWQNKGKIALSALIVIALVIGYALPQILPSLELSHVSHRAGAATNWTGYTGYTKLAMPVFHLVTLFLPGFYGNPTLGTYWGATNFAENACYIGALSLLLSFLGVGLTWRRDKATRFFAIAAIISLLMALGTPLDALLFFGIPGFSQSGSPARILCLWTLCAAILAAVGTDALLKSELPQALKRCAQTVGMMLACCAIAIVAAWVWWNQNSPGTLNANVAQEPDLLRLPIGILLGAFAIVFLWTRGTITRATFSVLLTALAAVDLLAVGMPYNRTTPPEKIYPMTPTIAFLQQHAGTERIMPINQHWSLSPSHPPRAILPPNSGMVYGLNDTQGYDSLLTGQYMQFAGALDGANPAPEQNGNMVFTNGIGSRQAQLAAAKYLVSLTPLPTEGTPLQLVSQEENVYLYEDSSALKRVRSVSGGQISIATETPTRLELELTEAGDSHEIVVADQWYPGWHAWVNGKETEIAAEPEVFRTLRWSEAPNHVAGKPTQIVMRYLPATIQFGLYSLCLALAATIGIGICRMMTGRLGRRSDSVTH